jgi:outer membrane protein assembly factor BamB
VWTTDLAHEETRHIDVDEPPVLLGGRLYAASFSGGLYALDPATGSVLWRADVRGATRPVRYRDTLLTTSVDGRLLVLDGDSGAVRWSLELEDRAPGRISLVGNYLVLPTTRGALYVLDAATPHIHARYQPSSGFASAVTGPRGRVVALDNDGVLHGLRVIYE